MSTFSILLYNLALQIYYLLIWIAALFNPKAKKWINGRQQVWKYLQTNLQKNEQRIWVHVASLGEFEQGRPIIEALKKEYPTYKIILTFFSPSGYEIRKNYQYADYVCYLPLDTKKNAQKFIQTIQPQLVVFVKYEFWHHFLTQLHRQKIPTIIACAIFRPQQIFFKPYGQLFRDLLKKVKHIFVQNQASLQLLKEIDIQQVSITSDTRFDRVYQNSQQVKKLPLIAQFKGNRQLFIGGSTWPKGEALIAQLANQTTANLCFVIAPHEIKEKQIQDFITQIKAKTIRYSQIKNNPQIVDLQDYKVLVIDNIGMLSSIYQYGDYAYIGGGFGVGLHNTLEAAIFGMPIFIGPNHTKFQEACELVEKKGAFVIENFADLSTQFQQLQLENNYQLTKKITKEYVEKKIGGTEIIITYCKNLL